MIAYIQGEIILKKPGWVIVKSNSIGYEVFVSEKTLVQLSGKKEAEFFTYLDVGERSLKLYGFLDREELELFRLLRDVSGVGPKAALHISSIDQPEKIKAEIMAGNEKILDDIPGIGPKKARKIILELSGKIISSRAAVSPRQPDFSSDEAFIALQNLGFEKEIIKKVFSELPEGIKTVEEKISRSLKILGKQ